MRAIRQRIAEHAAGGGAERQRADRKQRKRRKPSVASHPAFLPIMVVWGAALMGLSVSALAPDTITRTALAVGIGSFGGFARWILALTAAGIGAGLGFFVAKTLRTRIPVGRSGSLAAKATQLVRPIDPASELGSESLDAPLEEDELANLEVIGGELDDGLVEGAADPLSAEEAHTLRESELVLDESQICEPVADEGDRGPTLGELSERGYENEEPTLLKSKPNQGEEGGWRFTRRDFQAALEETCESMPESERKVAPTGFEPDRDPADAHIEACTAGPESPPRELDLAEFAELPGRNAVWVEDPASAESAAAIEEQAKGEEQAMAQDAPSPMPTASALEKLREVPPHELSLVQMVERFAAALHEHQAADRARPHSAANASGRDAALAEALKALTLFAENGFAEGDSASSGQVDAIRDTTAELREALAKLQNLRGAA